MTEKQTDPMMDCTKGRRRPGMRKRQREVFPARALSCMEGSREAPRTHVSEQETERSSVVERTSSSEEETSSNDSSDRN